MVSLSIFTTMTDLKKETILGKKHWIATIFFADEVIVGDDWPK